MIKIDDAVSNCGLRITGMIIKASCPKCNWHGEEYYAINKVYLGEARMNQIQYDATMALKKKHHQFNKRRRKKCPQVFEKT